MRVDDSGARVPGKGWGEQVLKELAKGVFVKTGYASGNVGLILTGQGALLVDTPMLPRDAREWQYGMPQLGVASIYGIVNTDYHPEHFLGNALFMPTRILGHELAVKQIVKYKSATPEQFGAFFREEYPGLASEVGHTEVYIPEICVSDCVTLYMGDRRIEVLYLPGHTPGSLGVYLPEEHILFAGEDIVSNEHPVMAQANSLAWLDTLTLIQGMDVEHIVPANGEVCGKEVLGPLTEYITEMRRRVTDLFHSGASRRECVDKVGMLDYFPVPEEQSVRIRRRRRENVERVYAEIRMAQGH
jgi:cyclase